MKNKPLVSIIIPTHNSEEYIKQCLESIEKQSYKNIEVIVVDQTSSDKTTSIAKRMGARVFTLLRPKFYSPPTKSRNLGAKNAKGDILYHLDSDMILSEGLIQEIISTFQKKDVGALIVHEEDITKGFWAKCKALERRCYWGNEKIESSRAVRKEVFNRAGGYDENINSGEDFDIHRRYKLISKIGFCKNVVFHDLGHLSFIKTIRKKYNYGKTAGMYFKKNSESGSSILKEEIVCYIKNYKHFLESPVIGFAAIILKICEFGSGGLGYYIGRRVPNRA